jgi:hypothetical protein
MTDIFMFTANNCPSCGLQGKKMKGTTELRKCPACSTVFSEFGVVHEGENPQHKEMN